MHLKPWELDKMEFYRIEYILKNYEKQVKKENEEHEKQRKAQESQSSKKAQTPKLNKSFSNQMKIPKPKFK